MVDWNFYKRFMLSQCLSLFACLFTTFIIISSADGATLAEVNQVPIPDAAVEEALQAYLRQIGHRELSKSRIRTLQKEILKRLIEEELIYQEGFKTGLVITEEEIEKGLNRIRDRFPSEEDFEKSLSKEVLSLDDIRKGVARSILIKKTWETFSSVSDSDRSKRLQEITEKALIQVNTIGSGEQFANSELDNR